MSLGDRFDDVLDGARRGDRRALEDVYRDLAPVVLGYLRAQGAREPEDLASEVFVALVKGIGRFRGDEAGFRSWVFTIAHRRLVDERRRLARRREDVADAVTVLRAVPPAPPADVDVLRRLGSESARALLDGLTDDQREVVLLRVLADLPVAEVARVTGRRPGAVKTLQRRALIRLARRLQPSPGEEAVSP